MSDEIKKEENENGEPGNHPGGRPTLYNPSVHIPIVKTLSKKGYTVNEIAVALEICKQTIYTWMELYPEFLDAINEGKNLSDERVEHSLYERANGYTWIEQEPIKLRQVKWIDGKKVESETIEVVPVTKVVPPDFQSMSLWLRNRRPKQWRDKTEVVASVDSNESLVKDENLTEEEREQLKEIRRKAYLRSIGNE